MVEASFTLPVERMKAIVNAYKNIAAEFVFHFSRNEVSASVLGMSRVYMIEIHLKPNDYRCDVESIWVRGNMDLLWKAVSKLRKTDDVKVSVREGKFWVGTITPGAVVDESAIMDEEKFKFPEIIEAASLSVMVSDFRRVIKSPPADLAYMGLDVDAPNGHLLFSNKQQSIMDLGPGQLNMWLLNMRGRCRVLYDRELFSSLFVLGLSEVAKIVISTQDLATISYEEPEYTIRFFVAPLTDSGARIAEILAKPRPARTEIFEMSEDEIKKLHRTVTAISKVNPHGNVTFVPQEDLALYWSEGNWQGTLRIPSTHFDRWQPPPEAVSGLFYSSNLVTLLKDLETLRLFQDVYEGEKRLILVGVGPKVAPKELVADQTTAGGLVPTIKGTTIFTGPLDLLKRTVEDADVAGDLYLVFYTTPYEINAFGRNAVYYSAAFETDSFKVLEENHVSIPSDNFKTLIGFFGSLPAELCGVGKVEGRPHDIYIEAETSLGEFRTAIPQEEYQVSEAEKGYEFERAVKPKPGVEELPVAPPLPVKVPPPTPIVYNTVYILADVPTFVGPDHLTYGPFKAGEEAWIPETQAEGLVREGRASRTKPTPKLLEPNLSPKAEVGSVSSGPFRFVLLNDGEIMASSMGRFLSKEELETRPEVMKEARTFFRVQLDRLGIAPAVAPPPEARPEIKHPVLPYPTGLGTEQMIKWACDQALNHIQNGYIWRTTREIFGTATREEALKFLREQLRNSGAGGPDVPDWKGSSEGLLIVSPDRKEEYRVTWTQLLSYVLNEVSTPKYGHVGPHVPVVLPEELRLKEKREEKVPAPPAAPPTLAPPKPAAPPEERPPRLPPMRLKSEEVEEVWQQFVASASSAGVVEPLAYRDRFIEMIRTSPTVINAIERARRLVSTIQQERGKPPTPGVPGPPTAVIVPAEEDIAEIYRRLRLPSGARVSDMIFQTVWYQIQKERGIGPPAELTLEERDYLWREFSDFLKRFEMDPEMFMSNFEQAVNPSLDVIANLNQVMDKARGLTDHERWGPERWR